MHFVGGAKLGDGTEIAQTDSPRWRDCIVFVSSSLAVGALLVEQVTRRMRTLDNGPEWVRVLIAQQQERLRWLLGKMRYESIVAQLFENVADVDADGSVDRTELYCMTLQLYLLVTQYMPQCLTPPSKQQARDSR